MRRPTYIKPRQPLRAWTPYFVLAGAALLTFLATYYVALAAETKDRLRFENSVQHTRDSINNRLDTYVAMLRAATGLFAASGDVTRDAFDSYVDQLDLRGSYPGIQAIGFSKRLRPEEKDAFIARVRSQAFDDFQVWPEGERAEYHPVVYIEPLKRRNRAAIGYDMFSEVVRREAMETARDTGQPAASGKVRLIQEVEGAEQAGFLIYVPVYRNGLPVDTADERRAALDGFVYSPFRADDLLEGIFGTERIRAVAFQVYDGGNLSPAALLHDSRKFDEDRQDWPDARFKAITTLDIAGRTWTAAFSSQPEFDLASGRNLAPYMMLGGLVITFVLFSVTRAQMRARRAAESIAEDLRQSESMLRESEARFRALVEQSPLSTQILAPDGRTLQVNRAWEELFGVTLDQVSDYNLLEDKQLVERGVMPYIKRAFAGEACAVPPVAYVPDRGAYKGRQRWTMAFIYPVKDDAGVIREVVLVHQDITERKLVEERLHYQYDLTSAITNNVAEALCMIDESGRLTFMNPAAEEMLGWRHEELVGKMLHDSVHYKRPDGSPFPVAECPINNVLRTGEPVRGREEMWIRKDGGFLPIFCSCAPIVRDGEVTGAVLAVHDITERRRIEAERAELLTREQEARRQAEAANRMKDEFLATVSHELRTPLNAILGWAALLQGGRLDEATASRACAVIESNAKAQSQLINDILDVSRIITGKLRLETRQVELAPVVEAAIDAVRPAADAKGISLVKRLQSSAPVLGDPDRLQQVVWNLLSNAIKFTPGGGRVEVQLVEVPASSAADGWPSHVEVRISDTGQGINRDFLPYVFDRFSQADGSLTRRHGGLGLGLAIVRHLVEMHGGSVRADSEGEARGATFSVRLPAVQSRIARQESSGIDPRQSDGRQSGVRDSEAAILSGLRVLVVDDDDDARETLTLALEQSGAEVKTCSTASDALESLQEWRPSVLVSDIAMPGEDGYSLINKVRGLEPDRGGAVIAIALTARVKPEDRRRALSAGYQAHIPKPAEPFDVVGAIASLAPGKREENGNE